MKKIIYLAFISFFAMACTQPAVYKISGSFDGNKFENATIFIKERVSHDWKNIDSVEIKNGKFQFSGKADTAKICYLNVVGNNGDSFRQAFILENGNITVKIDTAGFADIAGTKENDVLSAFNFETGKKEKAMMDFYNAARQKHQKDWAGVKDYIEAKTSEMQKEINKIDVENASKYVNTLAGTQIFMGSFYNFTVKEKEELFSKMDDKTKSIPRIAELIEATNVEKKTSEGAKYVDFTMPGVNGKPVSISGLVGKTDYLLIDFWASWCPDCRESLPGLVDFYQKNHGQHFDIVGVSLDKKKEKWTECIEKFGLKWQNISDLKFWDSEGAKLYAVNSIPATILIDKNGIIVGRNLELKKIQELLNQIVTK